MWACALERGDSSELPHPYRCSPGHGSGFSSKTSHIFAPGGTSRSFQTMLAYRSYPALLVFPSRQVSRLSGLSAILGEAESNGLL